MTNEWDADRLDLDAYLERLGHEGPVEPTANTLKTLHRAHIAAIPFENLDIPLGRGISVDLGDVQRKLVHNRRGGYCYEHGLLLAAALERMGFEVERLLARVGGGDRPRPRTHMVLRVRTSDGEPWLADTGFGSGLLEPIPFAAGTESRQGGWAFRLAALGPGEWELQERRNGGFETRYAFADERQHPADVVVANHFTSTFPRSPFVGRAVVVRKDEHALRELVGRTLTTTRPDGTTEAHEVPARELGATLEELGLPLPARDVAKLAALSPSAPGTPRGATPPG